MAKKKPAAKPSKDKKPSRPTRCPPGFEWSSRSPLIEATDMNDVYSVKRLLSRGADPNEALHHAIGRGKFEITQILLEAGANVHTDVGQGDYWVPPPAPPKTDETKKKKSAKGKKKKK